MYCAQLYGYVIVCMYDVCILTLSQELSMYNGDLAVFEKDSSIIVINANASQFVYFERICMLYS